MAVKGIFSSGGRLLHLALLTVALASCSGSPELVRVRLKLGDWPQQWVYLCRWDGSQSTVVDSARTNLAGVATLQLKAGSPDLYEIADERRERIIILAASPGDRISLEGRFDSYSVAGSRESFALRRFQEALSRHRAELSSLRGLLPSDTTLAAAGDSAPRPIAPRIDSLNSELARIGASYVRSNLFSLSSMLVLTACVEGAEVLPYASNRALFLKADSCLNSVYPNKPVVQRFRSYISARERHYQAEKEAVSLTAGDYIPPVSFSLVDGRTVSIPGLWGRLILIDFWADWCEPCQHQPLRLKPIHDEFVGKGLQIVQVAASIHPDTLRAMAARDSLGWMHVAEGNSHHAPLFKSLGVVRLPANFLVDRWGRVVATNLYGDTLASTLRSFLEVGIAKPKVSGEAPKEIPAQRRDGEEQHHAGS